MGLPQQNDDVQALFAPLDVRAFTSPVNADLIGALHDDESVSIGPMAAARQAEFATARACARAAMADLGVEAAVPRRTGGAPRWPDGMAGSISHTRGFCVAVASRQAHAIGIDVEQIARMKPAVERRVLIGGERALVETLADAERQRHVATIFAAKEAFYKAHYEVDARYLGFDAVHVHVVDGRVRFDVASGEVASDLLAVTTGRFRIDHGRVTVGVAINASTTPSALPSPA